MELKFKSIKSTINESGTITGSFLMSNLLIGQGLTIANALRRVLLSNLEGTAITGIKIPNIVHEFSVIPGIREDILEIILNLKQIVLKTDETKKIFGKIKVKGPGIITASCLNFDNKVTVINPNQYIATVSQKINIDLEIIAETGIGYSHNDSTEQNFSDFISIDGVFMPVINVNYKINNIYISYNKTFEVIEFEITTNGSITPEEALNKASQKLIMWFSNFTNEKFFEPEVSQPEINIEKNETILIEELELPIRAYNCLKRAGINSINELTQYSEEEISEIKNFGKKSAVEVFQALKNKFNITLSSSKFL
jgi:DNA-directed RNA polymerase subunit alpha